MADKKLNESKIVKDMDYVLVTLADGSVGQIANSDLASVVAGLTGINTLKRVDDANTVKTSGDYVLASTASNIPVTQWGTMKVSGDGTNVSQTFHVIASTEVYMRITDYQGLWLEWQRIDNFGYNSLAELSAGVAGCLRVKTELYMEMNTTKTINLGIGIFKIYYKSQPDHQTMLISISEDTVSVMGESWFTKHLSFSLTETSSLNVTYTAADNTFVFEKISL